eukprot:TRINITY_DN55675_c0_g1_i1.p1 TRINITY_DN55675_c0_g1~~TRINITY_DN55675_c0_g1_i1.p1  ORF type:complete len:640 (-),score=99.41 TRINITY_DN55675_c0_g1_i1:28-1902(-)
MAAFLQPPGRTGGTLPLPAAPKVSCVVRGAPLASGCSDGVAAGKALWRTGFFATVAALVVGRRRAHQRGHSRHAGKGWTALPSQRQTAPQEKSSKAKDVDRIPRTPEERALAVNLDSSFYGSFAEIGAGQEVSRWFLRAGAANGTVARTVSAYDMQMSDRMYGPAKRYVTKERMFQMFEQEYGEIESTLRERKGSDCRFFSFASTIAAKAFKSDRECEGWLGIMYQKEPGQDPSVVWLHARMSQPTAQLQSDALGILGANLVYLVSDSSRSARTIIRHLMADVDDGISINWVSFSGPGWTEIDDRLVALWLVMYGVSEAVVFEPVPGKLQLCEVVVPNQAFYKRPLLVQRGRFCFVSRVNEVIFEASKRKLEEETKESEGKEVLPLIELVLTPIGHSDEALLTEIPLSVERDFVSRFNVLSSMRVPILISGLGAMHRLTEYLMRYTNQKVVVAVGGGSYSIERGIFRDSECEGLAGGLLEAFGKIFARDFQMYVFPNIDPDTGAIISGVVPKSPDIMKNTLLAHLRSSGRIVPIENKYIPEEVLNASTNQPYRLEVQEVLNMVWRADDRWKDMVPSLVVDIVQKRGIAEVLGALEYAYTSEQRASAVSPIERFSHDWHSRRLNV